MKHKKHKHTAASSAPQENIAKARLRRRQEKLKHRAGFGIGIDREYWGLGIGRALTEACIECAEKAGYAQLELDVTSENERAVELYKKAGFVEFGRNPKGFRSRESGWQELILMRRELSGGDQE